MDPVADIDNDAARATFARYDLNGDGHISVEEFKRVMAEMGDPFVTGPVAEAVLAAKDANGDGVVTFEEFFAAAKKI
ncbi:EF-hand domain-containing protein [Streptomyces sp. NPDC006879]|uniref:EF-hand domain-containing protein n=1 Tax=Streptomyces sp. NPDC006879 TaxID=3364767 RepID=UPI00368921B3